MDSRSRQSSSGPSIGRVPSSSSARRVPSTRVITVVDVEDDAVTDDETIYIYRWLDSLEFSKSRKTSANRDFADGVMMAELIALYIPKIINSTYCIPTYATSRKIANWEHLNKKVLRRIRLQLTPEIIKELATSKPGMIERVLRKLQPLLFLGSKAVAAPSRKLENVKARFLDFEKSYLKKDKGKGGEESGSVTPATGSRHESVLARQERWVRARTPSRGRTTSTGTSAPPPTATLELKVIKTPKSRSTSSKRPTSSPISALPAGLLIGGENYEILTRPSTGRSSNDSAPSPSDLLAQVTNLKVRLDKENGNFPVEPDMKEEEDHNIYSKQRGFLSRSSWLPVVERGEEAEPAAAKQKGIDKSQGDQNNNHESDNVATEESEECTTDNENTEEVKEEEADEEIYCDQSGYEEDTEDAADDDDDDEEEPKRTTRVVDCSPVNYSSSSSLAGGGVQRRSRKLKRVVKYEYREEYILNGMANFQLPNSAQLENVRKNYMSPGNKDPNCRGYGFV